MSDILLQLGALAGVVLAGVAWIARMVSKAEKRGKQEAEADAIRDTQERMERGREALRNGRGADPDERLRNNDGLW